MHEEIISCSCGMEALRIRWNEEDEDDFLELCILDMSNHRPSFWNRLRWIWRIIKYGYPYGDQICLEGTMINELHGILSDRIRKRMENKK